MLAGVLARSPKNSIIKLYIIFDQKKQKIDIEIDKYTYVKVLGN